MHRLFQALSFGEILWDIFPDGKTLGGAPLNIVLRLQALGAETAIISRLGSDKLAEETHVLLEELNFNQVYIQEDASLPTGQVIVNLDANGNASYTIAEPVAWDAIALTSNNRNVVASSDVFIFGSLALRSKTSRETLDELLPQSNYSVFDVNLRPPHYDLKKVIDLFKRVHLVKLNEHELQEIVDYLNIDATKLDDKLQSITDLTGIKKICVTFGEKGAVLWDTPLLYRHHGYKVQVVDTIGAGDSFLAGLLYQLFLGKEPKEALTFANALGSLVAGKKGANAEISMEEITTKIKEE